MAMIQEGDKSEIKSSVRSAYVHEKETGKCKSDTDFACEGRYHHVREQSKICLMTIRETYEDDDRTARKSMREITSKISTASCHKRRRGYQRKYEQRVLDCNAKRDLSGLIRCSMINTERIQNDTGATHNITSNINVLHDYKHIPKIPISGIAAEGTAIYATGRGYLPVQSEEGDILMVECLYSEEAAGTLLSPTAIAMQYSDIYFGWTIYANVKNNTGFLQLINEDGINHLSINMYYEEGGWYHYIKTGVLTDNPTIRKMSTISEFELWHHRMGHMNTQTLCQMHKYARGIPKLKTPDFYQCQTCSFTKLKKDSSTQSHRSLSKSPPLPREKLYPGQHLHMDFGFVRGSKFVKKDEQGRTITSLDGFRAYLIIVDRATRYKWIFLTTTKHPSVKEIDGILSKFRDLTATLNCTVRTDQGGELGKSNKIRELIEKHGYTFEPTGSNSSKQNGIAERPNQDLKRVTRALLRAAGLDSSYWSFAINHAVFLLNRSYHSGVKNTPYFLLKNEQPDLSQLRIFGSRCFYTHTKTNTKAMDDTGEVGTFLGYTATMKNVYVRSSATGKIHTAFHKSFDEAFMTEPEALIATNGASVAKGWLQ